MSNERDVAVGKRIEQFLADEDIQEALRALDERYARDWRDAKTVEEREDLWRQQRALQDVLSQLKIVAGRGAMAQASLTAQARRAPITP